MSDKLRKALENAISVIESVRESGAVDADDLLWLDRECAAAANAGYIALAARHDSPTLDVQRLKAAIAKHQEGRPYSYSERCVPHCAPDIAREYAALAPADPTADLTERWRQMRYHPDLKGKSDEYIAGWDAATRAALAASTTEDDHD